MLKITLITFYLASLQQLQRADIVTSYHGSLALLPAFINFVLVMTTTCAFSYIFSLCVK